MYRACGGKYGSVKFVYHKSGAQFRLEPCGFRRHDIACVGYIHELLHAHRIKRERECHLARVDAALEFAESADSTHEVYPLVGAQVGYAEDIAQNQV